jgi:hypothetical protein
LKKLYSFSEAGILPRPIRFTIVDEKRNTSGDLGVTKFELHNDSESDDIADASEEGNNETSSLSNRPDNTLTLRLTVGNIGTDDCYRYDMRLPNTKAKQMAKHRLAEIAVCDLLGSEILEDDIDDDEEEDPITATGYDWEIPVSAESNVTSYIYGILWNLQTYQVSCLLPFAQITVSNVSLQ